MTSTTSAASPIRASTTAPSTRTSAARTTSTKGFILKYLKSQWRYHDATNVVGYYRARDRRARSSCRRSSAALNPGYFTGDRVVIDPARALSLVNSPEDPRKSLWVFRYYDLDDRSFDGLRQGAGAAHRLRPRPDGDQDAVNPKPPVNIIAHSMGGLIVREAVQCTYPGARPARRRAHQQDRDARHAAPGHHVPGHPRLEVRRGGGGAGAVQPEGAGGPGQPVGVRQLREALSARAPADRRRARTTGRTPRRARPGSTACSRRRTSTAGTTTAATAS